MNKRRIQELTLAAWELVFNMLDGDPDLGDGNNAGAVATAAEQAVHAKLTEIYGEQP